MKLTRLCKAASSMEIEDCPAIYVAEDPTWMVGQGKQLDADTAAELVNIAHDEVGAAIPTETVLRAAGLYLAAHGRPVVAAEVETFLSEQKGGTR